MPSSVVQTILRNATKETKSDQQKINKRVKTIYFLNAETEITWDNRLHSKCTMSWTIINEHNRTGKYEVGGSGRKSLLQQLVGWCLVRPASAAPPTPGSAPGGSAPHFAAGPAAESAASAPAGSTAVAAISAVGIAVAWNHKERIIKEQDSYVPSSELELSQPLFRQRVCPSPQNRGGGDTRLMARGWGSPNSDDWRKSLALCLQYSVSATVNISL